MCDVLVKACTESHDNLKFTPGQWVHSKCRQKYTKPQEIVKSQCPTHADDGSSHPRRSLMSFTFKENCLFCGHELVMDKKRTTANETSTARTLQIKDSLLRICDSRRDEWQLG